MNNICFTALVDMNINTERVNLRCSCSISDKLSGSHGARLVVNCWIADDQIANVHFKMYSLVD